MQKSVVFDFDGVIIDSLEVQRKAFYDSFQLVSDGPLPSFEEFLGHSGDSIPNIFAKMNLPQSMVEHYRKIASSNIHLIEIVAGMEDVLRFIQQEGWKCGLCTGKDRKRTIHILEEFRLIDYFDGVVCSDDVTHPKPHPESLLVAIEQLQSGIDHSVFVGDGKNDLICAREAQVKSIAVAWGHNSVEVLQQEAPTFFAYSVDELRQALQTLFQHPRVSL
ncbi:MULTISPECIES: HAD family hydrolase [Brevibacillus]|jgi:pyrophosphatase PpaX|uniref:HAD family hydrolase n=1 Tax=Brevibacillus TaxID=55080 RepID=UPI000ECE0CD6|nr:MULTISPECIES: HAD family hydrolase [Brevibacillus]MDH6351858.1 pyrophosphatase PpaX [Brevibacillus sp. 1238]MDR5002056.1 HAD family hydrolase [Brevibacillus parabrevis]MED1721265.1 HAD family hydrolase [Brevibacillus parabrevis]MED2253670.1 HAD family hydrolase [Brevibacillus parabrevis]UED66661.1 HAD family hydrolase [Brevibacillus sp. HD3.3A]